MILGRLDTIGKNDCLICEDITYGLLLPITNEDPNNWIEVDCPQINMKGVNSKHELHTTKTS